MSLNLLLNSLNAQQRRAAMLSNHHALVLAGAGTGKTKTIVARAAYLIDSGVPAHRIRILTFTRRSASEIVERVKLTLGDQAQRLGASTFHSWCMSLIHAAPKAFGAEGYTIIDRDDQLQLYKALRGKKKRAEFPSAGTLCDISSFARNTGRTLTETLEFKEPDFIGKVKEIGQVMLAYEGRKQERRYLDYDDILEIVAQQITQSDATLDWMAAQYDHILIDEMQDTNPLQWGLLNPLKEKVTLFAVGDDAQSIYGFRGADFKNIHKFPERVPGSTVLKLQDNYRSTQEILEVSNWLLEKSSLIYGKELSAVRGSGIKPQLLNFSNEWDEGGWVAQDIKCRKELGSDWREHMILVRSGFSGRVVESALLQAEIPYQFIGGQKLLESAHVRDTLSVLRLVANPQDEIAWMRFLTLWPGVGEVKAAKILNLIFEASDDEKVSDVLTNSGYLSKQVVDVVRIVSELQGNVSAALLAAFEGLQNILADKYKNQDWEKRKRDIPLVGKLAEKHSSILAFIEEYLLDPLHGSQVGQSDDSDKVTVITIHSAKGTECKTCYVINVSPGAFPSSRSKDDDDVEEERRVLYVAMTRAKDELIVTRRHLATWGVRNGEDSTDSYFLNSVPGHLFDEHIQRHSDIVNAEGAPLVGNPVRVGIKL